MPKERLQSQDREEKKYFVLPEEALRHQSDEMCIQFEMMAEDGL